MGERVVLPLVLQEILQVHSGKHAAIGRVADKHGVQLRPPQQLPAEHFDLSVVQTTVS